MAPKNLSVTPLASLCLGVVRGWINVASRGKGGQIDKNGTAWTRLPADQLKDQLSREFRVEVSTRSVHRALQELSDAKLLRRQQKWKHRYRRDYWYAIPKREEQLKQHSPRSVQSRYVAERRGQNKQHETTAMSVQGLPTSNLINHSYAEAERKPEKQKRNLRKIVDELCKIPKKHEKPKGFGTTDQNSPGQRVNKDGRTIKDCWVGGRKYEIVD